MPASIFTDTGIYREFEQNYAFTIQSTGHTATHCGVSK